jgi:hypothetical protein
MFNKRVILLSPIMCLGLASGSTVVPTVDEILCETWCFCSRRRLGWNQNGGLELSTFDNHDPKSGCVRLNDGMVRFIRTREGLE